MKQYHQTAGASQRNAFTAHLSGNTQIDWSAGQASASLASGIAQKAKDRRDKLMAEGKDPGFIAGLGGSLVSAKDLFAPKGVISIEPRGGAAKRTVLGKGRAI